MAGSLWLKLQDGTLVPVGGVQPAVIPAGTIDATIAVSEPPGYLFFDQTVAGADVLYPNLWAVAPAGWKSGADLVLPSMDDHELRGAGATAVGDVDGVSSLALSEANMPSHSHTTNLEHSHDMSHTHSVDPPKTNVTANVGMNGVFVWPSDGGDSNRELGGTPQTSKRDATLSVDIASFTSGGSSETQTGLNSSAATDDTGGGDAFDNRSVGMHVNWMVKT